ncbi:hypothetical protein HanIR_Chr15g0769951 [Helianthus annuus]|nr:hypothetical protein HanIR_Chr15g0769951 [Helianthus annuus]
MYQELTARVDKLDTSVAEIKEMLQQLLKVQKVPSAAAPPPTVAPSSVSTPDELWSLFQPLLHHQRELADQQYEIQVQKIRNLMEARFKDTQADIKEIKAHILNTTGTAPPSVIFVDNPPPDNAKKGEKLKQLKKKGYEDGLYIKPQIDSMLADIPLPDGSKKIDVTTNAIADAKASVKRDKEAKDKARFEQEKRVFMELNEQGISEPKDDENPELKKKESH